MLSFISSFLSFITQLSPTFTYLSLQVIIRRYTKYPCEFLLYIWCKAGNEDIMLLNIFYKVSLCILLKMSLGNVIFFFKNIITLPSKGDGNDLITICLLPEFFWILSSDLSRLVCLPFLFLGCDSQKTTQWHIYINISQFTCWLDSWKVASDSKTLRSMEILHNKKDTYSGSFKKWRFCPIFLYCIKMNCK